MNTQPDHQPKLRLFGATSVGIGAIVGGGILALAGTAFATTGPSAILAFALNGVIALLTALSLSEMASRFPESGGTYIYSKKVLSVEAAFSVGWVACFASMVAGLLYALGLAWFLVVFASDCLGANSPAWLLHQWVEPILAIAMTLFAGTLLIVKSSGGSKWTNVTKLLVFAVLVGGGLISVIQQPAGETRTALTPFFANGFSGLLQAMGYTFIALQGFDLIAAVGGEVRQPEKNLPRAMILSLLIALALYLPLLFVVATVGMDDGVLVFEAAKADPEGIVAVAAGHYLGGFGYWLVIVAAILAMYSALEANIYASSRIIFAMAKDRTLPSPLRRLNATRNPTIAVATSIAVICTLIFLVRDVSRAGAVASLIFLVTFAISHWISILVRQRSGANLAPFRVPFFPAVPIIGGLSCLGLAIFQGVMVPSAGVIATAWLAVGAVLFLVLFASRARIRDATASAFNPELIRLRGRSPLVLVPIANPDSAEPLITLANCLVPHRVGRVLLQNIVVAPDEWDPDQERAPIQRSQAVLEKLMAISTRINVPAEALTTIATQPMPEIARVAALHQCQSIVMGLADINNEDQIRQMEKLMTVIHMDIVILRARLNWQLSTATRILVPIASRSVHEEMMSTLLGSLSRNADRDVTYVRVVGPNASDAAVERETRSVRELSEDQMLAHADVQVIRHSDAAAAIAEMASDFDLVVLGSTRTDRQNKLVSTFTKQIARMTDCPLVILCSRAS